MRRRTRRCGCGRRPPIGARSRGIGDCRAVAGWSSIWGRCWCRPPTSSRRGSATAGATGSRSPCTIPVAATCLPASSCTSAVRATSTPNGFGLGDHERVVYDTGWVPPGSHWNPFSESSRSMQPAIDLRLGPRVLLDRNSVELRYRLRPGLAGVGELRARLAVHRRGVPRTVEPGTLLIGLEWAAREIDVSAWEPGTYWFELLPELEGRRYAQGPRLRYRRPPADPDGVLVSPLAPFRLRRTGAARRWRSTTGSGRTWAARGASIARVTVPAWSVGEQGELGHAAIGTAGLLRAVRAAGGSPLRAGGRRIDPPHAGGARRQRTRLQHAGARLGVRARVRVREGVRRRGDRAAR